ncbi:MAG: hypothetical protein ACREBG_11615 [Pyrinomonadaceae bacterium]
MSNERAREVAQLVVSWLPNLKTFDGIPIAFDWKADFERRVYGEITAYGREEAGKARHEMNQQIGEYLHQPANSKSTLQMLEDGLREERERALEQGFRFGWGASMSDMHWHEAIQKCRALAQRETQETLRCSDCGNVWHGQPPCPKCGSSGTMRVMDQAQAVRRPKIVCLCGSTKFKDAFEAATWVRTQQGEIVLSVGCFMHSDSRSISAEQKIALDELHKRKIDLADEVLVLNVAGYIGSSTRSEIEYAEAHGKPVSYLEAQANEIQQDTRRSADSQMSGDANRVEAPEPHPGNCAPALNLSADLLAAAREGCDKLSILAGNRIPITNLMVEAVAAAFRPLVERLEHQRADEFASMDSQNRELQAELVELRKPMACSVCAGTGVPFCGKPCICGGAGIEAEEIKGLRMELYKANERDRDIRERAERLERDFAREQDIVIALRDGQLKLRAEIVELRSAAPPAFTITVSSQDE